MPSDWIEARLSVVVPWKSRIVISLLVNSIMNHDPLCRQQTDLGLPKICDCVQIEIQ
jgi:hypothetical protein